MAKIQIVMFNLLTLVLLVLCTGFYIWYRPRIVAVTQRSQVWCVLVAGSRGWINYRHQADVLHAHRMLTRSGVDASRIITFLYDDIAYNQNNPFPGVVRNQANGTNLYRSELIDYKGSDVTLKIFERVLLGLDSSQENEKSWKTLQSSPSDTVLIYFAGHGGQQFLAFPDKPLTRDNLRDVLLRMKRQGRFNQMLIYLEACESGSMFAGLESVLTELKVLGVTATNSTGPSYACCYDSAVDNYLGDAFSVSLFESSQVLDSLSSRVSDQVEYLRNSVPVSEVTVYGDGSQLAKRVYKFFGWTIRRGKRISATPRTLPDLISVRELS